MDRICPLCSTRVQLNGLSMKLDCGHLVHTKCMDQDNPDFEKCKTECKGRNNDTIDEPDSWNGHDYIAEPSPPSFTTTWRQIFKGSPILDLMAFGPKKCPVESLIVDHGYPLQRILAEGGNIRLFLDNGYTWEDLKKFKGCQTRLPQTLFALGCTAEHLREYPVALPVKEMGLVPQNFTEHLGLYFDDGSDQPVVVDGENNRLWTAKQLADFGFTFDDLKLANMRFFEQYEALQPTNEDDARLGVNAKVLEQLPFRPQQQQQLVEEPQQVEEPLPPVQPKNVFEEQIKKFESVETFRPQRRKRPPRLKV